MSEQVTLKTLEKMNPLQLRAFAINTFGEGPEKDLAKKEMLNAVLKMYEERGLEVPLEELSSTEDEEGWVFRKGQKCLRWVKVKLAPGDRNDIAEPFVAHHGHPIKIQRDKAVWIPHTHYDTLRKAVVEVTRHEVPDDISTPIIKEMKERFPMQRLADKWVARDGKVIEEQALFDEEDERAA